MNGKILITLLFCSSLLILLNSCNCICDCDRNLGCKILTAKLKSNDSVLTTKMFCSQTNYETDITLRDSVGNFTVQYQTDSTTVTGRDSIYKYERAENIKCKEKNDYKNNGYGCMCYK